MINLFLSTLAFKNFDLNSSLKLVKDLGYIGVEVAPMKFFQSWDIKSGELLNLRAAFLDHSIKPISLVSVFYGSGIDSLISKYNSNILDDHLLKIRDLALKLDIKRIIIGAPSLRALPKILSNKVDNKIITYVCDRLYPLDVCFEIINYEDYPLILDNYESFISKYKSIKPINLKLCFDSLTLDNIKSDLDSVFTDFLFDSIKMIQLHLRPIYLADDVRSALSTLNILKIKIPDTPISIEMQNLDEAEIIYQTEIFTKRVLNENI